MAINRLKGFSQQYLVQHIKSHRMTDHILHSWSTSSNPVSNHSRSQEMKPRRNTGPGRKDQRRNYKLKFLIVRCSFGELTIISSSWMRSENILDSTTSPEGPATASIPSSCLGEAARETWSLSASWSSTTLRWGKIAPDWYLKVILRFTAEEWDATLEPLPNSWANLWSGSAPTSLASFPNSELG